MATSKNPLLPKNRTKLSSKLVQPDSGSASTALPRISSLSGATTLSMGAKSLGTALTFGTPSSAGSSSTSSSGSVLTNLLKQTASGGIASALGGGLSGLFGLGSIISGFASLFGGGKSALPPLVQFQEPAARDLVSYVSSVSRSSTPAAVSRVTVSNSGVTNTAGTQTTTAYQYQSTQIAQAVKQALLNSSSLNDVISEI